MAMLLVRVIPSLNKEQAKQNGSREEDFYEKYGDLSLGYSPLKKKETRELYKSIKTDSNVDQKFE